MSKNPDGSISIHSIGDRIEQGQEMSASCNDCQWSTRLNLEMLAEKLGPDHSALAGDLKRRLKCSRCGSKNIGFIVQANAGWDGTGGHSLSVFNKDGDS